MKERIKKIRRELELTQQEFAERLGTARNNIAGYETGNRNPSDAVISLICTKFKVNETWLREGTGEMFLQLDMEDKLMEWAGRILGGHESAFKKKFVTMLMNLSEHEWEWIEEKAAFLAGDMKKGD
ncbi:MAG: helix-turn-helix transcriptional regulator [Hungatella sp.]|nr:helix-turn-helix transcriptional regulator [Hungatella sp.]